MARCWEERGCDEEMQSACAHATVILDMCPTKCAFANCERPQHVLTSDPAMVFRADVDRNAAIKQLCIYCEHFLTRGPRLEGFEAAQEPVEEPVEES